MPVPDVPGVAPGAVVAVAAAAGASASVLVASAAAGAAASAAVSVAAGLSSVLFLLSFFLTRSRTLVLRFSREPKAARRGQYVSQRFPCALQETYECHP